MNVCGGVVGLGLSSPLAHAVHTASPVNMVASLRRPPRTLATSSSILLCRGSYQGPIVARRAFLPARYASSMKEKPDAGSAGKKTAARTVKKVFAELPKAWVNADGSTAAPLGQWLGGLEAPPTDVFASPRICRADHLYR